MLQQTEQLFFAELLLATRLYIIIMQLKGLLGYKAIGVTYVM